MSRHLARSSATRIQLLPAVLRKSSLHLAWGRPTLRLPRRGLHSKTRLPQRLSVLRLIWPAHCYFSMLIRCAMSVSSLPDHLVSDSIPHRNPEHSSFRSEDIFIAHSKMSITENNRRQCHLSGLGARRERTGVAIQLAYQDADPQHSSQPSRQGVHSTWTRTNRKPLQETQRAVPQRRGVWMDGLRAT
jgi:hypothetical protein